MTPQRGSRYWLIVRAGLAVDMIVTGLSGKLIGIAIAGSQAAIKEKFWRRLVRAGVIVAAPDESP